jgi:hypothetical protein
MYIPAGPYRPPLRGQPRPGRRAPGTHPPNRAAACLAMLWCCSTTADGCSLMATPKVRRPPHCRISGAAVDWRTDPQADRLPVATNSASTGASVGPAAALLRVAPAGSSMSPNPPCRVGLPRVCARCTRLSSRPLSAWLASEPIRCAELLTRDDASLYSPYRLMFCDQNHRCRSSLGIRNLGRKRYHHGVGPGAGRADLADR